IAVGAAFAEKYNGSGNLVVAYFGDGAVNQGAFHEACNLAGVWKLPVIFFIENNLYAVGTHSDEATAVHLLSQRANSYAMNALIVDGHDTVAIHDAMSAAAADIRDGGGPWFIEAFCYRKYHHAGDTPGSAFGYRSKDEEAQFEEKDAMVQYPRALESAGIVSRQQIDRIKQMAVDCVQRAVDACTNPGAPRTVRSELWPEPESAVTGVRSDGSELAGVHYAARSDFAATRTVAFSDAIAAVTGRWLERDERVVVLGEEVASFGGGAYGATRGLPKRFPQRVLNTPISEAGFVGLGLGAAMSGMRPVVEIMFPDFSLVAADQLFNQIAKARHMYGGTTDIPLVLRTRIATGCGYGGQHSMDPIGLFALFPGWRIVSPSNAFDYIGLFNTAMRSNDPVVFLEHHALYKVQSEAPSDDLDYCLPFGKAELIQHGDDVSIVTYGVMTERLRSLRPVLEERGVSADIIDLRTLDFPSMDFETVGSSLQKTGALITVEEAAGGQSIGNRLAGVVSARYFDYLDAPCFSLTSLDVPNSVSRVLETEAMLDDARIVDTVVKAAERRLA
ncbi:MAG: MFS transporter, partial [Spirochaetaceae bacterium]